MKKVFCLFAVEAVLMLSIIAICDTGSSPVLSVGGASSGLRLSEVDGSPDVFNARQLKFPNGTLTNSSGAVTFAPSLTPSLTSVTVANGASGGLFGLNGSTPINLINNIDGQIEIGGVSSSVDGVSVFTTSSGLFRVWIDGLEDVFIVRPTAVEVGLPLRLASKSFAELGTPVSGTLVYCNDCTKATPCAGSGSGAVAKRINSAWDCD